MGYIKGHFLTFRNMSFFTYQSFVFSFSKHKLFILVNISLFKILCKNIILKGHLVVFLSITSITIMTLSYLENKKNLVLWF